MSQTNRTVNAGQAEIKVINTAEPVLAQGVGPGLGNPQMQEVIVKALKTNTAAVFIGPAGVTTANGFELAAGESTTPIPLETLGTMFMVSGTIAQKLCFLTVGP